MNFKTITITVQLYVVKYSDNYKNISQATCTLIYYRIYIIILYLLQNVLRFWLDKGVDGFRIDAMIFLCEDQRFLDEPLSGLTDDPNNYDYTEKIYTTNQPQTYDILPTWRKVLDEYEQPKYLMIEAYANISDTMKYYHYGADFPFNFYTITNLTRTSTAADIKNIVDLWYTNMPEGGTANWVVS